MTAAACAACGETLRPAAHFCGACGTPSPAGPGAVESDQDPNDTVIIATAGGNLPDPDRTVVTDAGPARTPPGTDPAPGDPGITMTGAALPPPRQTGPSAAFVLAGVAVVALLVIFPPISDIEIEGVT